MFRQIGAGEIILILAVLLLLFGSRKLPELARSLGKSARELRKGMREDDEDEDGDGDQAEASEPQAATGQATSEPDPNAESDEPD